MWTGSSRLAATTSRGPVPDRGAGNRPPPRATSETVRHDCALDFQPCAPFRSVTILVTVLVTVRHLPWSHSSVFHQRRRVRTGRGLARGSVKNGGLLGGWRKRMGVEPTIAGISRDHWI